MALPSSLGSYTTWNSTDILNRFADGRKPTVADWEAIRPYLFPMQVLQTASNLYIQFKELYDRYITQGTVLDTDFFTSLFSNFIRYTNWPFWSKYINKNSPYYTNSDLCLTNAFANGAKPNGTIFAEYLKALLSPIAFTESYRTGFVLQDAYNSVMKDIIIQGEIIMTTANNVRAHKDIDVVYNIYGRPNGDRSVILMFPQQCMCTAVETNLNAKLVLHCRGKITDVGENTLIQTRINGLFSENMSNPILQQVNPDMFSMTYVVNNVQPVFIVNAYALDAVPEGMGVVYIFVN